MSEFIHVEPVRYWCHKILPLVYDDSLSYMELLNKVVYKLNEVVNNNNEIPAYIAEQIKNYINSGEIRKVVQNILANYSLNVKFPPEGITPAVGDGTADDTAAFQGCLDYAHEHGGMMVFVPAGKYLCGNLTMYSGCSIKGDGRYDTTIVMRGGVSNPFIGGELDAVQIADIGIDGNADIQVNNVDVFNVKLSNALLTNLFLTDGYTLLKIQENGGDIQIDNVVFDKAVVRAVDLIKGVSSRVQMTQVICRNVSKLNGESAMRIGTDGGFYDSIVSVANAPIGIEVTGNNNYVVGTVVNAVDSCKDTGENNNIKIVGEEESYNISGNYMFRAHGGRGVHVDGVDSVNVGSQNVVVNGDSTFRTAGQRTEQYDQSVTENVAVRKTIKADTIFADTKKPIMYSEVRELNRAFKVVPMLDKNGQPYNLLVEGDNIDDINASYVSFEQFGAVGDGVTDDTTAIKNAVAEAENTGKNLVSLAKTYFVTDTIAIDCHKVKNVNITGTIMASFTNRTILKLYTSAPDAVTNAVINCKVDGTNGFGGYQFPATDEGFDFPNFAMKGIELLDINRSIINCSAANCGAGIVLTNSSEHGVVFNTVNIGDVYNCVVSLSLEPANSGWINSNTFVGGGFQIDSKYSAYNKRTVTIRLLKEKLTCNSNTFIAPSFETGGLPLLFNDSGYNTVRFCRNENNTDYIAKFTANAQLNIVETLYGLIMPSAIGDGAANNKIVTLLSNSFSDAICIKKWDFDKNKCFNVGTRGSTGSSTIIDGVDYVDASNIFNATSYWSCSITDDGLIISGNDCIGCLIDTHAIKNFYISAGDDAATRIIPMNEQKQAIEEEPIGPSFREYWKVSGITAYTGSPLKSGTIAPLAVTQNTKYVFIGFTNKVKTFSIFCVPYTPDSVLGNTPNITRITSDIGARKIPSTDITSKCDTGAMLPACNPTGTALAYICTDGEAQTWEEIKKPTPQTNPTV